MAKILKTITSCHNCEYSVLFSSSDAEFDILACTKTEKVLKVVHQNEDYKYDIPGDCPLPDFIEPKIK